MAEKIKCDCGVIFTPEEGQTHCNYCGKKLADIGKTPKKVGKMKELKEKRPFWKNKYFKIAVFIVLTLIVPYLTIPALLIWLFQKNQKISKKVKVITYALIGTLLAVFLAHSINAYSKDPEPTLEILSPKNNAEVQTDSIEIQGTYEPKDRTVWVNGKKIQAENGNFSSSVTLKKGENKIKIQAGNWKRATLNLTIVRVPAPEELAEQEAERKAEEERKTQERQKKADEKSRKQAEQKAREAQEEQKKAEEESRKQAEKKAQEEQKAEEEKLFVQEESVKSAKKIGVSYNQMMNYLSNFFTMEKSTPVDGEDRYMGTASSGLATLEIIGGKDNITQASLMIGIPNDSPILVTENSAIMLRFLKNAVPEWEDITDWFTASLEELTYSSNGKIEKLYGDKVIKLTLIKELGMMMATVEHK
jgi:hypothetical protein